LKIFLFKKKENEKDKPAKIKVSIEMILIVDPIILNSFFDYYQIIKDE
jgi:hypothetical protein